MATHQQPATGPPKTAGETYAERTASVDPEEYLELLGDEYTRRVLGAITDQPRTGREIIEATDASKPTVYRRLGRLEEMGLVATDMRLDADGHHCKQFRAVVEAIDFEFGQDGIDVSVQATSDSSESSARRAFADD